MKEYSRQAGLSELELRNGLKERLKSNEEGLCSKLAPVSYTHLTLPTNREV